MSTPVPTPVAAALGVVPTVFGHVRRLPTKVVQLPIFAISSALTGFETARREYAELAERGERLIARLRGTSFDELEDRFEDSLQGTRLAKPYDAAEDALEDAAEVVTNFVRRAPATAKKAPESARKAAGTTVRTVGKRLDKAADSVEDLSTAAAGAADAAAANVEQGAEKAEGVIDKAVDAVADKVDDVAEAVTDKVDGAADAVAEKAGGAADKAEAEAENIMGAAEKAPGKVGVTDGDQATSTADEKAQATKGEATPKATQPDVTRIDTAASESVVETVERVSQAVGGDVLDHADLPLADYDHMTLGSLRGRMRSLDVPQLAQIRAYEKAHADRLPIVTMLDNRIAKLATDPSAPLSGNKPAGQPS